MGWLLHSEWSSFFNIVVTFACLRVSGKVFVSKEKFAINEIGSLKEVFNSFNTFVGILEGSEDLLVFRIWFHFESPH